MKVAFVPGAEVCPKGKGQNLGVLTETAKIVKYDGECFYIVETSRGRRLVVHEDDVELVPRSLGPDPQQGYDTLEEKRMDRE